MEKGYLRPEQHEQRQVHGHNMFRGVSMSRNGGRDMEEVIEEEIMANLERVISASWDLLLFCQQ